MPQFRYPHIIDTLPLFSGLTPAQKADLLSDGRLRQYARGDYLFHHGDPITSFYIVCSGVMQLVRANMDGDAITTDVVIPGKTIGKREILHNYNSHHQVSALAVEDAVVVEFPAAWLKKVAVESSVVALNILSSLSQYAHMVQVEFEHKSNMTTGQQVACFLQRVCLMHGFDPEKFKLPYSKTLIASRLGMEPETFSRALLKLSEHGIDVSQNHVRIHDFAKVDAYVCEHCSIVDACPTHKALIESAPPIPKTSTVA